MKKILTDAAAVGNATARSISYRFRRSAGIFLHGESVGDTVGGGPLLVRGRWSAAPRCPHTVLLQRYRGNPCHGIEDGRHWFRSMQSHWWTQTKTTSTVPSTTN